MKIIGITGTIGSGKSYVALIMASRGLAHLDTDEIYHSLVSENTECSKKINEFFGDNVMSDDGSVNRKELAKIVFSDKKKLEQLNKITHEHVTKRVTELISELDAKGERAVLIEVPIMFESGFNKLCDSVICVTADKEVRVLRIMQRSGLTREEAELRISNQKNEEFYTKNSDHVIYNNGSEDLNAEIDSVLKKVLN